MKATFEDRLLEELKREIAARGPQPAPAPRRRVVTVPRLALAAGLATAAAVTAVVLPGSPGASKAYAVDQNGDGSVTVNLFDLTPEREEQDALVARLRALGVLVSVDSPPAGTACAWPRGEVLQHPAGVMDREAVEELMREWAAEGARGIAFPMPPGTEGKGADADWQVTLHRGDTLVIERNQVGTWYSAVKGAAAPCDPQPFARPRPIPSDGTRGWPSHPRPGQRLQRCPGRHIQPREPGQCARADRTMIVRIGIPVPQLLTPVEARKSRETEACSVGTHRSVRLHQLGVPLPQRQDQDDTLMIGKP